MPETPALFVCSWYSHGMRDFHLAFMRENAPKDAETVSVVRIVDDRDRAQVIAENARFGAARTHVFRSSGKVMRNLTKLAPIFPLYVFWIRRREHAREILLTYEGYCWWAVPSFVTARCVRMFVHDPVAHESANPRLRAAFKDRYFRFVDFAKRWKSVIVGSESNRAAMEERGARSPVEVLPFPVFDQSLFEGGKRPPELDGIDGHLLFFGRVDVYKGVVDWIEANPDLVARHPVVVAGQVIDDRIREHADRIVLIDRFIDTDEVAGLFAGARALLCPYLSATHSGIVDMGLSFGVTPYVSRIPYFEERYGPVEAVRFVDELPADLEAAAPA